MKGGGKQELKARLRNTQQDRTERAPSPVRRPLVPAASWVSKKRKKVDRIVVCPGRVLVENKLHLQTLNNPV